MALTKKCRHGAAFSRRKKLAAWRACGCQWYADLYVEGRRRFVGLKTANEQEARAAHARLIAEREANRLEAMSGTDFSEVAERWLIREAAKPGARPGSIISYRSRMRHVVDYFGDKPVERIGVADIRAFLEGQLATGRKPNTVAVLEAALISALTLAQAEGLIEDVPRLERKPYSIPPKSSKPRLSLEQAITVADALPEPCHSLAWAALLTGCRVGELQALTPQDVDLERGLLRITKSLNRLGEIGPPKTAAGVRTITLSPKTLEVFRKRVERVGPSERLWPVPYKDARLALNAVLVSLGLYQPGLAWHAFRDAHTALLDEAGTQLRDAGQRLGHGPDTTQTLAYGWAAEASDTSAIDAALSRHEPPPEPEEV